MLLHVVCLRWFSGMRVRKFMWRLPADNSSLPLALRSDGHAESQNKHAPSELCSSREWAVPSFLPFSCTTMTLKKKTLSLGSHDTERDVSHVIRHRSRNWKGPWVDLNQVTCHYQQHVEVLSVSDLVISLEFHSFNQQLPPTPFLLEVFPVLLVS